MILARLDNLWVPAAWLLLLIKESGTYRAALENLRDEGMEATGVCHLDFESGEHKALLDVFPSTRIVGCDFHWKKGIILIIYLFLNNLFLFRPSEPLAERGHRQHLPEDSRGRSTVGGR